MKRGDFIHFWWSASDVASCKFVRWRVMKMHTGREDTHKLGVGTVVSSDWRFSKIIVHKVDKGLKRGQYLVRPYTKMYRSYNSARRYFRPIKRPTVAQVRKLEKRRKVR